MLMSQARWKVILYVMGLCALMPCPAGIRGDDQPDAPTELQHYQEAKSDLYKKHFADGSSKQDGTGGVDPQNADIVILWDDKGNPDGWGDSAWRTGLAATAVVLEGDDASALRFLRALSDRCWDGDQQPLRHPSYLAWKSRELHGKGMSDTEIKRA